MKTFKEFITENYRDPDSIKGWMNPKGEVHLLDSGTEHGLNLPTKLNSLPKIKSPEYYTKSEIGSNLALSKGYARFGKEGVGDNYVHFDHTTDDGKKSAYHALKYLNPNNIHPSPHINIQKSKELHSDKNNREELKTNKRSEALTFILK